MCEHRCDSPCHCPAPLQHMKGVWDEHVAGTCMRGAWAGGRLECKNYTAVLPSVELLAPTMDSDAIMRYLEAAIRTAYKSEDRTGPGTCDRLLRHILASKHESTLEHFAMGFRVITSRGVSHELVRHRVGHSFTQESTRYVNYGKGKPEVILPWHLGQRSIEQQEFWLNSHVKLIDCYLTAVDNGWPPQDARGFLPNDMKTELVWTMNIRSARNMLQLRTPKAAHPDMQVVAREILRLWFQKLPVLFQDIEAEVVAGLANYKL